MSIKKLIVEVIELAEEKTYVFPAGYKYSVFLDPETGKYYEPTASFEVTGEQLEDLFNEVDTE